jgi:TPR repeat protein
VREDSQRALLFEMDNAIQQLTADVPDHPSLLQLTGTYHNLLRRWARSEPCPISCDVKKWWMWPACRPCSRKPGKAAQAILAAAGQGAVEAQLLLGQILLDGRGIEEDATVARRWFGIAAQGGSAMAHNMLGRCLEHGWGGEVSLRRRPFTMRVPPTPGWTGACTTWATCWRPGVGCRPIRGRH